MNRKLRSKAGQANYALHKALVVGQVDSVFGQIKAG